MADKTLFSRFSHAVSNAAGKPITFAIACAGVLIWAVSGPIFHYSETWQLVINTSTTIITFLMVFILQNTQNRDGEAIQAKLDELILSGAAQNKFIGAEKLSEKELAQLRALVAKAAKATPEGADNAGRAPGRRRGPALKTSAKAESA